MEVILLHYMRVHLLETLQVARSRYTCVEKRLFLKVVKHLCIIVK